MEVLHNREKDKGQLPDCKISKVVELMIQSLFGKSGLRIKDKNE